MNAPLAPALLTIPHSVEAEQTLIGILLNESAAFDRIVDVLAAADLFAHEHRPIFGAMADLHAKGESWDTVVVYEALGRPANGTPCHLPYLTDLSNKAPGASNVLRHAEIVRARAQKRELLTLASTIQDQASASMGPTVEKIVAEADVALVAIEDRSAGDAIDLATSMDEALAYIDARQERKGQEAAIRFGLAGVDRMLGGLEPSQLIILGARASVGKTVLGVHLSQREAAGGKVVLFFSLEMSRREIAMRVLAARAGVSTCEMRAAKDDGFPWDRMLAARNSAESDSLYIDDKPAITVAYARAKARRLKRQRGLDLVVVDYLGLMKGTGDNRVQEIGSISRGLKALAKELEVPIVALAQLNRGVEGRADKRPLLSDLRDSGDIEQDADVVLMLHRESLYSTDPQWAGVMEVLIRKNRHGPVGEVAVDFNAELGILSDRLGPSPRVHVTSRREAGRGLD